MFVVRVNTTVGDLTGKILKIKKKKRRNIRRHTRPIRCSLPLPFFALLKLSRIFGFLWKVRFLIETSILTISCQTIRPAPMLRCLTIARTHEFRVIISVNP